MHSASLSIALDAVMTSMNKGLALESAARILRAEAAATDQHEKLSGMLLQCAAGLEKHPTPLRLCEGNASRLNAMISSSDPSNWGTVTAVQITAAAMAFERAAEALRQGGW